MSFLWSLSLLSVSYSLSLFSPFPIVSLPSSSYFHYLYSIIFISSSLFHHLYSIYHLFHQPFAGISFILPSIHLFTYHLATIYLAIYLPFICHLSTTNHLQSHIYTIYLPYICHILPTNHHHTETYICHLFAIWNEHLQGGEIGLCSLHVAPSGQPDIQGRCRDVVPSGTFFIFFLLFGA